MCDENMEEQQQEKGRLKCRFCDWTTSKRYTNKSGKFRGVETAQQRLLDHALEKHPSEYMKVQEMLSVEILDED
jgi:hypothetical protein